MNNNESDSWPERFRIIQDVNELIATARLKKKEEGEISFPLEDEEVAEDLAISLAASFLCNWILFFSRAPIEGQTQVDEAIESFVGSLRKLQAKLPKDNDELKKAILHDLKVQLIGPNHPLY